MRLCLRKEGREEERKKSDQFVTLAVKNRWRAHRPPNNEEWSSTYAPIESNTWSKPPALEQSNNHHALSRQTEKMKKLTRNFSKSYKGNFDAVLEGVGKFLGLEALVV